MRSSALVRESASLTTERNQSAAHIQPRYGRHIGAVIAAATHATQQQEAEDPNYDADSSDFHQAPLFCDNEARDAEQDLHAAELLTVAQMRTIRLHDSRCTLLECSYRVVSRSCVRSLHAPIWKHVRTATSFLIAFEILHMLST